MAISSILCKLNIAKQTQCHCVPRTEQFVHEIFIDHSFMASQFISMPIFSPAIRYTVYFYSGAWMRAQVVSWGMNVYVASVDSTPSNAGSGREYSCGLCGNFDGNPANDSPGFRVTAYAPLWPCMKVPSIATRPRDGTTVTFGSIWDWVRHFLPPSSIFE